MAFGKEINLSAFFLEKCVIKLGLSVPFPFSIRRFEPKDLHQVVHINEICLPENYSNGFFTDLYERFPDTFIVAEKDGTIIGYIMCRVESGFFGMSLRTFSFAKKGHIISIAVLPENRNIGVGHKLIDEALQAMSMCYEAGSCYLEVRVSNTNAINLYKQTGFEVERTVRGYYSDGEDAYIMSRKLPGRAPTA
jgi:ribosomal-protein-alanine N-acetyltransferase